MVSEHYKEPLEEIHRSADINSLGAADCTGPSESAPRYLHYEQLACMFRVLVG